MEIVGLRDVGQRRREEHTAVEIHHVPPIGEERGTRCRRPPGHRAAEPISYVALGSHEVVSLGGLPTDQPHQRAGEAHGPDPIVARMARPRSG